MRKPDCYGECPVQQWLYDSHENLEETIRQRQTSNDPHVRLSPQDVGPLRNEQRYFRDTSHEAARTCVGLVAQYILHRTTEGDSQAVLAGRFCDATLPETLAVCLGRPEPRLSDNR